MISYIALTCTDPEIADFINPASQMLITSMGVMSPIYAALCGFGILRRVFWNI